MFTSENVCEEIKELANGRITMQTTTALAALVYIKEHLRDIWSATAADRGPEVHNFTWENAIEWVQGMQNADGTHGPHWTMEKTEEARKQRGIQCDPHKFYVAMNMMYSDYVKVAEKVNASNMDFYAYMTQAFLDDKDAQPDKLARYYRYIVEH